MRQWLQITSGRGPEECCWVVARVAEKILSEAAQNGLKAEVLETTPGPYPKTFRSALFAIEGESGVNRFFKTWAGTVQWIGTSMFRPNHKRKNWFVGVELISPPAQNFWKKEDIKMERMKASGPGGQHVNKTESAVRLTHIPTGLSVIAKDERSQHLNQKLAYARLFQLMESHDKALQKKQEQENWQQHNTLERGNAVRVFKGKAFTEK